MSGTTICLIVVAVILGPAWLRVARTGLSVDQEHRLTLNRLARRLADAIILSLAVLAILVVVAVSRDAGYTPARAYQDE